MNVIASSGAKQGFAALNIVAAPTVATLVVTPASASLVVGRQLLLVATARDANNNQFFVPITWTTSDSSKATMNGSVVNALAPGAVTITASAGGKTAQTTLTLTTSVPIPLRVGIPYPRS